MCENIEKQCKKNKTTNITKGNKRNTEIHDKPTTNE